MLSIIWSYKRWRLVILILILSEIYIFIVRKMYDVDLFYMRKLVF